MIPPMMNSQRQPLCSDGMSASAISGVTAWPTIPTRKVSTEMRPRRRDGDISPM